MTVSLFQRLKVNDFDAWLHPDQDMVAQMMKEQDVLAFGLHRNLDDPNLLIAHFHFADEAAAKSFIEWMEAAIKQWAIDFPDVKQEVLEWWLGADVEGTGGDTEGFNRRQI